MVCHLGFSFCLFSSAKRSFVFMFAQFMDILVIVVV